MHLAVDSQTIAVAGATRGNPHVSGVTKRLIMKKIDAVSRPNLLVEVKDAPSRA